VRYVSPILMMDLPVSSTYDKKDLLLAKKKMLAELELAGTTTVQIKGKELSKNDILQLFERLGETSDFRFHVAVASDQNLIDFLEGKSIIRKKSNTNPNPLHDDLAFISWISPYYYQSFVQFADTFIKKQDTDSWDHLLSAKKLMDFKHEDMAWSKIEASFERKLDEVKALLTNDQARLRYDFVTESERLCDYRLINMMLSLPEERFSSFRDEYAFHMMELLIAVFNTRNLGNQHYATETLLNAKLLAVSEYSKDSIQKKHDEMEGLLLEASHGQSSSKSSGNIPWTAVVAILVFVFRMAMSCGGGSTKSSYDFPSYNYSPQKYNSTLLDSLAALSSESFEQIADSKIGGLNSFMDAIMRAASDTLNMKTKNLRTGADPYKYVWSNNIFSESGLQIPEHPFRIENESTMDGIFFMSNRNKVFSIYVKAGEKSIVSLAEGDNKIYMYIGQNFKEGPGFPLKLGQSDTVMIKGMFTRKTYANTHFLNSPFTQTVSPEKGSIGHLRIWDGTYDRVDYGLSSR